MGQAARALRFDTVLWPKNCMEEYEDHNSDINTIIDLTINTNIDWPSNSIRNALLKAKLTANGNRQQPMTQAL